MNFEAEYSFPHSAEAIFDFVTNLHLEPRWNPQLKRVEQLTPGPVGATTEWVLDYAQVPGMRAQTVAYERPNRIGWQFRSSLLDMDVTSAFRPIPAGGCLLHTAAVVNLKGMLQMVAPIVHAIIQQDFATRGPKVQQAYETWRAERIPE